MRLRRGSSGADEAVGAVCIAGRVLSPCAVRRQPGGWAVVNDDPLAALMAPLERLAGVGPALAPLLARAAGGARVLDLLLHVPDSVIDRRDRTPIRDARAGMVVTWEVEVVSRHKPATPRQPWRVVVGDGSGHAELVFFSPARLKLCEPGARLTVSGRLELYDGRLMMSHPEHVVPVGRGTVPALEPVWGLTAGLWPGQVRRALAAALRGLPDLPEWQDPALLRREHWPGFGAALRALHAPAGDADLGPQFRRRLAYDELLAHQLAMQWVRARIRAQPGRELSGDGRLRAVALERFGHTPTPAQLRALAEIDADLAAPRRMLRLLQGDVGSGKTLVALLAMLRAVEAGGQAALMAPTALLAQQHFALFSALSPVKVVLLAGAGRGAGQAAARTRALADIASGEARLIVGTHALFQRGVAYHDLALAVVDEQHRFGVDQRLLLGGKGRATDILVMSATPIPRSLLLARWGEMEVSSLRGKPAGRRPVRTSLHALSVLDEVADGVARALARGERVFWVCPLLEESERGDLAAAVARHQALAARFGALVGLAHGRQDAATRRGAVADFAAGRTRILVATTVIEVGIDVPEANVMVIEQAERFGLAQLHQLRGRVGRSGAQGFCLLLHADMMSVAATARLRLLRDTEDGFRIAEEDYRQRGGGDLLGTRQSGLPGWRLADPALHADLARIAAREAALIIARDPRLVGPRGPALRLLLRLFDRVAGMRALRAG